jgi:hypothetical protein
MSWFNKHKPSAFASLPGTACGCAAGGDEHCAAGCCWVAVAWAGCIVVVAVLLLGTTMQLLLAACVVL